MCTIRFNSRSRDFAWLSNMFPCKITVSGITHLDQRLQQTEWSCSEAIYQASKFKSAEIQEQFIPLNGFKAKSLAKTFKTLIRPDWESIKLSIMEQLVATKFDQHPSLRNRLLATRDTQLIEDASWEEYSYWGIGRKGGENHMGRILMKLRDSYYLSN